MSATVAARFERPAIPGAAPGRDAARGRLGCGLLAALALLCLPWISGAALAQGPHWVEGVNYFPIRGAHPPEMPAGKVEVTEVFSYACPACNLFVPTMHKIKASLPPNAVFDFLPASFNPSEDWPMFQLAYLTAQALGVADQTHDAMFNAVWQTGELAVMDPSGRGVKSRLPTIEDAAQFYKKQAGVPVEKFLATSKSFSVDMKVRQAETLMAAYGVDSTPTIVIAGKYRLTGQSAGSPEQMVELIKWLVAKETK